MPFNLEIYTLHFNYVQPCKLVNCVERRLFCVNLDTGRLENQWKGHTNKKPGICRNFKKSSQGTNGVTIWIVMSEDEWWGANVQRLDIFGD